MSETLFEKTRAIMKERAEKPDIGREMLSGLLDEFEKVMAASTNAPKRNLLLRMVKKVLIKDRHTVEVGYALPNRGGFEHSYKWLPG
jgi:hypothetical protein